MQIYYNVILFKIIKKKLFKLFSITENPPALCKKYGVSF